MSPFLKDAINIFETAGLAPADGASSDLGILIDPSGALRIVDAAGWRPEALQAHYGARAVYQVTRTAGAVRVSGRCDNRTCTLESERPATVLPVLPCGIPQYTVVTRKLLPGAVAGGPYTEIA